jgi:hypothetical protein
MHARTTAETARAGWYRQPVLWLGALLFGASLAGCVWMIVLGARHADPPVPVAGGSVFKVPLAAPQPPAPPPPPARAAQ